MKKIIQYIKDVMSEGGFASSTRLVKLMITIIFCFDWLWTRVIDGQHKFEPDTAILVFVASILGISVLQKIVENKEW